MMLTITRWISELLYLQIHKYYEEIPFGGDTNFAY